MNPNDQMREALRREFPLLDEIGLDQQLHHCEWSIQQDRKRLHQLLDELQTEQPLAAEPAPLVMLTDEDIKVLQAFHNFNVCTTSDKDLVTFAHAIQNAIEEKNK